MKAGGIITHRLDMMPLGKVTDLTFSRTFTGRLMGYGHMRFESAGQETGLENITFAPQPEEIYEALTELIFGDKGQTRSHRLPKPKRAPGAVGATHRADRSAYAFQPIRRNRRPRALIRAAADAGLDVVAVDRHDTTAGWAEATEALADVPDGLRLVRGAELSCVSPNGLGGTVAIHLLAYLFDPEHPRVLTEQGRLRVERRERITRMVSRMAADGYRLDPDTFLRRFDDDPPTGGRTWPRRWWGRGSRAARSDAFAGVLHNSSPYYMRRTDTPVVEAIEMITEAGGVCVFAHPFTRADGGALRAVGSGRGGARRC